MERSRLDRVAPLSGLVFAVLVVLGFGVFGGDTPNGDAPAGKVVSYYHDHYGAQVTAAILIIFAGLFFVWFAAVIRARIVEDSAASRRVASIVQSSGAIMGAGTAIISGIHLALADAAHHRHPVTAATLNQLDSDSWPIIGVGMFLFLASLAVMALRHGLLPRWAGWATAVLAVLMPTPVGWFALIVSVVVIAAISVMLFLEGASPAVAPSSPPPPVAAAAPGGAAPA
jgi:hypothetical protein